MTALRLLGAALCVSAAAAFGTFIAGGLAGALREERARGGGYPFDNRAEFLGWVAIGGVLGLACVAAMLVLAFLLATGRM